MGNQTEYNILRYSGEPDCSQYDAGGKSIFGKRPSEEDDALKNLHLHKLKYGKSVNANYSQPLNKIGGKGKIIIDKDDNNNGSEESNLIPKLQKPIEPSAVRDFSLGCGRYASPVPPMKPSAVRDFPPGYGRYASPVPPMKPYAVGDFPPRCGRYETPVPPMSVKVRPKIEKANQVVHMIKKIHSYKGMSTPKQLSSKNIRTPDPLYPSRLVTNAPKLPPSNAIPKFGKAHTWSKVKETLRLFQVTCRKLLQNHETQVQDRALAGKCLRVDLKASKMLRDNNRYVNTGKKIVGTIPGVEVGDQFYYRIELCIVGLHRQTRAGIDFLKQGNVTLATSIVVSGGYEDDIDCGDVLIYTGHGGNNYSGDKRQNKHQKLESGNMALKNNIDRKTPVRVIGGHKQKNTGIHENGKATINVIYTYDGIYDVQKYWLDKGASGYSVFKFQLKRHPGQPELGLKAVQF